MSIATEIARLYDLRSRFFAAIAAKGVNIPENSTFDDIPFLIRYIGYYEQPWDTDVPDGITIGKAPYDNMGVSTSVVGMDRKQTMSFANDQVGVSNSVIGMEIQPTMSFGDDSIDVATSVLGMDRKQSMNFINDNIGVSNSVMEMEVIRSAT